MQTSFESHFYSNSLARNIVVPDYQRAFSWEADQIDLFVNDLHQHTKTNDRYYFGHFIAESNGETLEIIDGQQRITTFVLFLLICHHRCTNSHNGYNLINRFSTVSYDREAFTKIQANLPNLLKEQSNWNGKELPSDEELCKYLSLDSEALTTSQRRLALALFKFNKSFNDTLCDEHINSYINLILNAECSLHIAKDKTVAVNIFEMHNTRGVRLTTIEIIKAILMKFVYLHGGENKDAIVSEIQNDFGEIYKLQELLSTNSFRGQISVDQILRIHLRIIDDGSKKEQEDLKVPYPNSSPEALIKYVNEKLQLKIINSSQSNSLRPVDYAINLAKELKRTFIIICKTIPKWDKEDRLVGDVMILERELSCEFFLIVCRLFSNNPDNPNGRISRFSLILWERLLYTRDFHDRYHGLTHKDNFQEIYKYLLNNPDNQTPLELKLNDLLLKYVKEGFRPDRLDKDLQHRVRQCLCQEEYKNQVLTNAYYWWKNKMIYAIYKYESQDGEFFKNSGIRSLLNGKFSVEHILPDNWNIKWLIGVPEDTLQLRSEQINKYKNGLGNLLLLTHSENSSQSDKHPAEKCYPEIGISYSEHNKQRDLWRNSDNWEKLIKDRGEKIYNFILNNLVGIPEKNDSSVI